MTCDLLPGDEAQRLLSAWESRDAGILSLELDRILDLKAESERLQLLQAIAAEMKSHASETRQHLWLGLLNYLASERRNSDSVR
jgi:hypothetical protein